MHGKPYCLLITLGLNKQLSDLFLSGHGGSMKTEKETLMM
jgi:hypothetical protein